MAENKYESAAVLEQNGNNFPTPTNTPKSSLGTIRKCLRKGSRICYADLENITVLRKIPDQNNSENSFEESGGKEKFEKMDSYRSGESLFKTFTFEQTRDIDDPETKKCIEFWKNVMRKNLAPIKCTLLENDSREKKSRNSSSRKRSDEKRESKNVKNELNFACEGTKIWSKALREIRMKKLDQLKLYMRERCKYCTDPFTKELEEKMEGERAEDQKDLIISLNDWKPSDSKKNSINSTKLISERSFTKKRVSRVSASQTAETRVHEASKSDENVRPRTVKENMDATSEKTQESMGKRFSIRRTPSKFSQKKDSISIVPDQSSRKDSASLVTSVEVQAPNIKCPCETDSCICPHKMAARNSRTNFIEMARKSLCRDDSTTRIVSESGEECVCVNFEPVPWDCLTCANDPCPAKQPEVKDSSSNFELHIRNLEACICSEKSKMTCASKTCKIKMSEGSLIEGYVPNREDCICTKSEPGAPCTSQVCPVKNPENISTKCMCDMMDPWSQPICNSWKCPRRPKIKPRKIEEEKITFKGHPPIKEVTSKCTCKSHAAWDSVTCDCQACEVNRKPSVTKRRNRRDVERRRSSSKSVKKIGVIGVSSDEEKCRECTSAHPWEIVKCQKNCSVKVEDEKEDDTFPKVNSSISLASDGGCVCSESNEGIMCRAPKCKNRLKHVEYTLPCVCPAEDTKDFICSSDSCKMKKIDRTCLCKSEPVIPCDAKTCVQNQPAPETLKQSEKPLIYDTECICKVRGFHSTKDISCVAPECPFQKKHGTVNAKPRPFATIRDDTPSLIAVSDDAKCVCDADSSSTAKCLSATCEKKRECLQEEDANTPKCVVAGSKREACVCDESKNAQEVVCNFTKCAQKCAGEDDAFTKDKCVCANMDKICSVQICKKEGSNKRPCDNIVQKHELNKYCYICGHYGCVDIKKQKQNCEEVFTEQKAM